MTRPEAGCRGGGERSGPQLLEKAPETPPHSSKGNVCPWPPGDTEVLITWDLCPKGLLCPERLGLDSSL